MGYDGGSDSEVCKLLIKFWLFVRSSLAWTALSRWRLKLTTKSQQGSCLKALTELPSDCHNDGKSGSNILGTR